MTTLDSTHFDSVPRVSTVRTGGANKQPRQCLQSSRAASKSWLDTVRLEQLGKKKTEKFDLTGEEAMLTGHNSTITRNTE
ncbi:hypothetical protein PAXRUDRAFT_823166 [Paxillus rubicundulus Ve08.2h10]|uniref:Uncharacterized protein n=1 Tax=Paxillus rubicundulus Ve08.2h10 TaxID=930991 RepID=A0A0D0E435_9AGAM|nr:hypothetical protein PAXRUDRAFT_823166 [Paxillus rubicundulus Ve08.2h10]